MPIYAYETLKAHDTSLMRSAQVLAVALNALLHLAFPASAGCSDQNLTIVFSSQWQFGHISPMLPTGDFA
jgi:hypothetical protein